MRYGQATSKWQYKGQCATCKGPMVTLTVQTWHQHWTHGDPRVCQRILARQKAS